MTGSIAAAFFAFLLPAAAQITSVSIQATTATQALLRFTAPDNGACTIEVSESSALTPLVHDVDALLFAGSNLDSRSGSASTGRERVFVIGKRRAEKAANARWYSRALQAYTPHYYRVTCGTAQVTGSFYTSNIALGNTYTEELPPDPNAGSAGYFVYAGEYAWPEFTNWDKNTGRPESVVDPHTGMLLKRITMPQDQPTGNNPAGDHPFAAVIDLNSAWSNPNNILADDGASATFSGTGSNWLFLRGGPVSFDVYALETMLFSTKAWCSGGTCSGDNAKIQACLTINGVSCWPSNANVQDMALGTAANPGTFTVAGSVTPIMTVWTPPGYQPLNADDVRSRSGFVDVDAAGNVSWTIFGDWFNPNWAAGSKITIAGIECTITSVKDPQNLVINPGSCALTLPRTSAAYSALNFGVMIRKKTASTDQVNIQFANYSWAASNNIIWPASGSPQICSDTLTQNTVTGGFGYHCIINGSLPMVYWIDHVTGDANYLGFWRTGSQSGTDGWANGGCGNASITLSGAGPTDPEMFYCNTPDNAGNLIVVSCSMSSTNQPGDLSISCQNLTPASTGKSLVSLIASFTTGQSPAYDPAKFSGCGISGIQNGQLIMGCNRGNQDSISWTVVFDPKKVSSAAGCVGGGNAGCVVAAENTWTTFPARYCGNHTLFSVGNINTVWQAGKFLADTNPTPGGMAQTSMIVSGALGSSGSISPASGGCPSGTLLCDVVTVDGEPCNAHPQAGEGNNGTCAKDNAQEGLQNAAVGDVMYVGPTNSELVQLVAKAGNSWTLQRGYGGTTPVAHNGTLALAEQCLALNFGQSYDAAWLWDFVADPHGLNTGGTTKRRVPYDYDHPTPRPTAVVGDGSSGYAIGASFDAAPVLFSPLGPAFAGTTGITPYGEAAQPHVSRPQDTAPASEQNWFLDARPLSSPSPQGIDLATQVSGQLYKFTSTTSDGDTLRFIGGPNAEIGGLDRKKQPTLAQCGAQPLIDISSAATGNVIGTTSANAYQYCHSRKANECRTGSAVGDIYVNCPYVKPRPAFAGTHLSQPAGTYGCWFASGEGGLINDICLYNTGAYLNAIAQIGYQTNDPVGAFGRSLTKGLIRYHVSDMNQNVRTLPDGSWLLFRAIGLSGSRNEIVAGKMPPYPSVDTVNRQTFVPLVLQLPAGDLGVDNVIVKFGYAENGPADQYFCTSRREACVAASATVPDPPFQFPSDGNGGTAAGITGVSCATGCSVAVPALPQRVVYYQVLYRDSANRVVAQSALQVTAAP